MKNIFCAILLFSSVNVFAAQLESDSFTINLEFNAHSTDKDFSIRLVGGCAAYSILGSTDCTVDNRKIDAKRTSKNSFTVPGFNFKSKTGGLLVSSYVMNAYVSLRDGITAVSLFDYSSEKRNLDLTNEINKYFESPIYITTVPSFDFETQGNLISSKVTNPKLKIQSVGLEYLFIDQDGKIIRNVDNYIEQNSKAENEGIQTLVGKKIIATKSKPSSLKVTINYKISYFGKSKSIKKEYTFDDLDNIDLSNKIREIKFEIVDEDIE